MNYLAHAAIAADTDDARLGSLLGDFSKGLVLDALPAAAQAGVLEHRNVDQWFDASPEVKDARNWFPPRLQRFAGILVDVFVDHVLVRDWDELRPAHIPNHSVRDVAESLYRAIAVHADLLPPRLQQVAPSMTYHDWLSSYGDRRNVERALVGIERRIKRDVGLVEGIAVLDEQYDAVRGLTHAVFPRLAARAAGARQLGSK